MDDDDKDNNSRYLPHELIVWEIVLRLPLWLLLPLRRVCRAWRDTITGDKHFHRALLRLERRKAPRMLVAPQIAASKTAVHQRINAGLYMLQESRGRRLTLLRPLDSFLPETMHRFAHCDGLVLLPSDGEVRVVNPATGSVRTLPCISGDLDRCHHAFGLGHDPRSGNYKVVHFFYLYHCYGHCEVCSAKMEVFTIGADEHWWERQAPGGHTVVARRTATFCQGSLLWTVQEHQDRPGFLRFRLDDEAFGFTPAPPGFESYQCQMESNLAVLCGELCLVRPAPGRYNPIEVWMCGNLDTPRWDRRYLVGAGHSAFALCLPIAAFDDGIVFHNARGNQLFRYNLQTRQIHTVRMHEDLRYHTRGMLNFHSIVCPQHNKYKSSIVSHFDVIPYIPSLVPI